MPLTLPELPDDVLLSVCPFLEAIDLNSFSRTSRCQYRLVTTNLRNIESKWRATLQSSADFNAFLETEPKDEIKSMKAYRSIRQLCDDFLVMAEDVIEFLEEHSSRIRGDVPKPSSTEALSTSLRFWRLYKLYQSHRHLSRRRSIVDMAEID